MFLVFPKVVHRSFLRCLCASLVLLAGCGWTTADQEVSFEPFSLSIPGGYQSVSAGLVENKQILHKVVKSFKLPTEAGVFSPNIVITSSAVAPKLDYEQFRTANNNKIKEDLKGYKAWKKDVVNFTCKDAEVAWIYIDFEVTDTYYKTEQTYYMAQYQFVYKEQWYIISFATGDPKLQNDLRSWIKTLHCI